MRRLVALLASVALAVVVLFVSSYIDSTEDMRNATAATAKPNIVFILTDDMRKDDLNLKYMPQTQNRLGEKGMTFSNAFVSNALCCPSRATIMRGQYSHNSGVWGNDASDPLGGGWAAYKANGLEQDNVATRLHDAGYRTGLFGKYLNGYGGTTYVPPKWDRWFVALNPTTYNFFNYDINTDGTIRHFGTTKSDYKTDVISSRVNTFISNSASLGTPFFAYVAPIAPHTPATPAPRDAHTFDGARAPRLSSFNEKIISDKPPWIQSLDPLTDTQKANIDDRHEKRIESLQAVDDLVAGVLDELKSAGVMSNTYIFFTSDNGYFHGEHRIPQGKLRPYEEDIRVPLIVRGPSVPLELQGSATNKLALNTDYLSTFTDLADPTDTLTPPSYVDGRSLLPVLKGSVNTWRSAILLEGTQNGDAPVYRGIRTLTTDTQRKYVEYEGSSQTEMYYLGADPNERFNESVPAAGLASRLQALKTCRPEVEDTTNTTVACSAAENGP